MSALPKHARHSNVYYLGWYVHKRLASNDQLLHHGSKAYLYQQKQDDYDMRCYADGVCPMCQNYFVGDKDG